MIFNLFSLNIHKFPTLSSLAFAIYRSNFFKKDTISQISGQIAKDIRQGYTGGGVDMYIPQNSEGEKVFCYDVNALYPYVMKTYPMPVGKPILFEGNIRAIEPDAFGFFYCKIIAPENLKHPIIQTHVKINGQIRTISPLGN
jgi:DNA polymerase type B, organellar and viral